MFGKKLRPRAASGNDRIVYITTARNVSYPDLEDWRAQAKSFEGLDD
jgi:hypothetical protein